MTKIYAHRGYSQKYPENTMIAFQEAVKHGVDGIELDVHLSKTNDLVVIHDETVDRTTNTHGTIAQMTRDEIKAIGTIPFLDEVLKNIHPPELNIELKTDVHPYPGIEARVLSAVKAAQSRIILSSFNIDTLYRIRALDKNMPLALIRAQHDNDEQHLMDMLQLEAVHYEQLVVLNNETSLPHDKIRVWTVNAPVHFKRLLQLNVGAIMTDDLMLYTQD